MTSVTRFGKYRAPKSELAICMDADDIDRLRRRAEAEGIGLTQLARSWILERLDKPEESQTVEALIEALDEGLRAARTSRRVMPR